MRIIIEDYDSLTRPGTEFSDLTEAMFRDRWAAFGVRRRWPIRRIGGLDIDDYDTLAVNPVYVIVTDHDAREHLASARLLPMSPDVMLNKVFGGLIDWAAVPPGETIFSGECWEVTRMVSTATGPALILLHAGNEFLMAAGAKRTVAAYDPPMRAIYKRLGNPPAQIGAGMFGNAEVLLGLFEVGLGLRGRLEERILAAGGVPPAGTGARADAARLLKK